MSLSSPPTAASRPDATRPSGAASPGAGRRWRRRAWQAGLLAAFGLLPAALGQWGARRPTHRWIHIDSFRYGKEPSLIRCNRGDWLHLTFSTRDTGHSFFLEEFDLDVKIETHDPGDRRPVVQVRSVRDPTAPPRFVREVVFQAQRSGLARWLASKHQYRCHVYCGPMHAFEHGTLLIEPNTLLLGALGVLAGLPVVGLLSVAGSLRRDEPAPARPARRTVDLLARWPRLRALLRRRDFQLWLILPSLAVFYLVVLAALFGTKMPGRNVGVMMMWVVWLFLLTAVLTPLGGRIWCAACPLPWLGETLQRGAVVGVRAAPGGRWNNRFFGLGLRWPAWLSNEWPRLVAFLVLGTFSTALVAVPKATGWVLVGLLAAALVMSLVWELRAFCRYLCPVTAFLNLYAKAGKLAVRAADAGVCQRCAGHWCLRGSKKGWACPFGVFAPEMDGNEDCGMCTECFTTCPHSNVTLLWRPAASETNVRSLSQAWLAVTMYTLAVAYCLVHLGHWPRLRDVVNIIDKGNWDLFAWYALVLWSAALVGAPLALWALGWLGRRWAGVDLPASLVMRASAAPLIPLGLTVWIAFVTAILMVNVTFVWQAMSDPFGWGWNLLGAAGSPWRQLWPSAVPWIQAACVVTGAGYSLNVLWRVWLELARRPRAALRGAAPMAAALLGLAAWHVWFFTN